MLASDLDELEASLGIILPEAYRKTIRRLTRRRLRGERAGLVCTDSLELLETNECARELSSVAGLPEWPESLFVIGEDGLGNYFAIHHDVEDSPVLFFDRERDEVQQCAASIEDLCKRIETSAPFSRKVLHRGKRPAALRSRNRRAVVPDFAMQPPWATSWLSFVDALAAEMAKASYGPATIKRLNRVFGSQVVRWTGRVQAVEFGNYPQVTLQMPAVPRLPSFPGLDKVCFSLRWADAGRSPGVWVDKGTSPQVLTSASEWRQVRPGHQIEFLMMFAPGIKDYNSCVSYVDPSGELRYVISNCGGHVLRIVNNPARRERVKR